MSEIVNVRRPYIDGRFVSGKGGPLPVDNPATEAVIAEVESASIDQVADAVLAARRAFDEGSWAWAEPSERAGAVLRMVEHFEQRREEFAETLRQEAGATATMLSSAQLDMPLLHIRQMVDLYLSMPQQEHTPRPLNDAIASNRVALSMMSHEPVGVVSCVSAYNYPFWINVWKVIPALLTGNTVVLRPSPFTPLMGLVFGEAAEAAGLPAGVLNVVAEAGVEGSRLLSSHPAVDQVSFTGSTQVGKLIMAQAAETVKRVMLELGGKSVQLYLPGAAGRAAGGCAAVFANHSGQACVAPTRMLVPEEDKAEVLDNAAKLTADLALGDPVDPKVLVGPLISAAQRARCESYVEAAVEQGAKVVCGGGQPASQERGYYFEPTVLDVPDNSNPAAQDEIFGPVISVIGYGSVDEAVSIANDSVYGLSGQVYGSDLKQATEVAARIRAGAVSVNSGASGAYASSGGYKQSGLGRERGVDGLRAYQQIKHLSVGSW